MKRRFVTMDVFTDQVFGGNPLGVVFDAQGLTTAQMQAIAGEFNYSETSFFLPPEDAENDAILRIFTPAREVPFAGHPNIGSAIAATHLGALFDRPVGETLRFEEKAGLVRIEVRRPATGTIEAECTAPEPFSTGEPVDIEAVARSTGLSAADILTSRHAPLTASVGLPFTFAEVSSMDALRRAVPGPVEAFHALPAHAHDVMIYVMTGDGHAAARMFGPLDGVPEDPATGSACAALMGLTASLDQRSDGEISLEIVQGVEMGRPSRILARAGKAGGTVTDVRIAGSAVTVFEGTFEL